MTNRSTLPAFVPALLFLLLLPSAVAAFERDSLTIEAGPRSHAFAIEIARTPDERARGLMFRTELAPESGMLFDFGHTQDVVMWMKNTLIPLDMIFIRADGTIANIIHRAEPETLVARRSTEPVLAVLELKGGLARHLGIKPGHLVRHALFGNE